MKQRRLFSGLLGLMFVFPSFAFAQGLSVSGSVQDSSGHFVTQLDNPVISGSMALSGTYSAQSIEHNTYNGTFAWEYDNFELDMETVCSATDPYCVGVSTPAGLTWWHPAPSTVGTFENSTMPFESHGAEIGHSPSDIHILRYDYDHYSSPVQDMLATVTLDPQTYLIPINAVVVVPDATQFSDYYSVMQDYTDPNIYLSLFDDIQPEERLSNSPPRGDPWVLQYYWDWENGSFTDSKTGMKVTYPNPGGAFYFRPDDVFSQCGVQFRLASVTLLTETNGEYVTMTRNQPTGGIDYAICAGDTEVISMLSTWYGNVMKTQSTRTTQTIYGQVDSNAWVAFFTYQTSNPDCVQGDFGVQYTNSVAVGVSDLGNYGASVAGGVLSHELGHLLSLKDLNGNCSVSNLMCESGIGLHIPYCNTWRTDGVSPLNCWTDASETPSTTGGCYDVRGRASSAANAAIVPVPMDPPGSGTSTQNWTASSGTITYNTTSFTEGTASLQLNSSGYTTLTSAPFRTADWFMVGNQLAVDIKLATSQPNPSWIGSVDMFVTIAAANIYNAAIGHVELTGLPLNQWDTIRFNLPMNVQQAFLGDYPAGSIAIAVNTPANAPPVLLDNIRMAGSVQARTVLHTGSATGGTTNWLFSFDNASDWSVTNGSIAKNSSTFTQGSASLSVTANGYTTITSEIFSTNILAGVTNNLSVDVYVPKQQPNPYWYGALQMFLTCPGANLNNQYIGQQDLTHLFVDEFNTVGFALPDSIVSTLQQAGQNCRLSLALNVNAGSGTWLLDNLAFR